MTRKSFRTGSKAIQIPKMPVRNWTTTFATEYPSESAFISSPSVVGKPYTATTITSLSIARSSLDAQRSERRHDLARAQRFVQQPRVRKGHIDLYGVAGLVAEGARREQPGSISIAQVDCLVALGMRVEVPFHDGSLPIDDVSRKNDTIVEAIPVGIDKKCRVPHNARCVGEIWREEGRRRRLLEPRLPNGWIFRQKLFVG
eukprot:scaffold7081_cov225-Pinguiococcus_pyrenoidosus.AAC.2